MVTANGRRVFDVTCKHCGITYHIIANRDDINSWKNGNGYIQDILGYLSAAERELLISGTCNDCWKDMFGSDDEEDEDEV